MNDKVAYQGLKLYCVNAFSLLPLRKHARVVQDAF